jgi:hypothetical protein
MLASSPLSPERAWAICRSSVFILSPQENDLYRGFTPTNADKKDLTTDEHWHYWSEISAISVDQW